MATPNKRKNPFYIMLTLVGIVFTITATSYFVMILKQSSAERWEELDQAAAPQGSLIDVMEKHGFSILMVELGLLAVCTVAAIMTDDYWEGKPDSEDHQTNEGTDESENV